MTSNMTKKIDKETLKSLVEIRSNPEARFLSYYLEQGIFEPENLNEIEKTLRQPLPACFRINPNTSIAEVLKDKLINHFSKTLKGLMYQDKSIDPPRALEWYPIQHGAWQFESGRTVLTKLARTSHAMKEFREFLMLHTSNGAISRQEAVSMIPVALLDVQPDHRVLDMCAAPGSKTAQIMEQLAATTVGSSESSKGIVIANDANEKRGYMLAHQLMRIGLESAVVTCHQGQDFPGLYENQVLKKSSVFDRVLCDVPCSGDGTIRKNPNIWRQWNVGGALSLHKIQLDLALRGAALLKPNGLMVYSTCSLNPIENEAVISELLRRADGALEIVDIQDKLPGLITRPGMDKWRVAWQSAKTPTYQDMSWFDSYDQVPFELQGIRLFRSMFPQSNTKDLKKCLRLFPTDQNTGGFFVTLLRKKHFLPSFSESKESESGLIAFENSKAYIKAPLDPNYICKLCGSKNHSVRKCLLSKNHQQQNQSSSSSSSSLSSGEILLNQSYPHQKGTQYTKISEEIWKEIQEFYGIFHVHFPKNRLFGRSDKNTSIVLVSSQVEQNCLPFERSDKNHLIIFNTGVRVFARVQQKLLTLPTTTIKKKNHHFRPTEEGLSFVVPFFTKRIFHTTKNMKEDLIKMIQFPHGTKMEFTLFSLFFQQQILQQKQEKNGPVVFIVNDCLYLPVWLGEKYLTLLIDKERQQVVTQQLLSSFN